MKTPKVTGIETEYGILATGTDVGPIGVSRALVSRWPAGVPYGVSASDPVDRMLPNGARLYVDHAHPEYSTAEAITPRVIVAADKAGEIIMDACCEALRQAEPTIDVTVYKNNTDRQGTTYGCHENYLVAAPTYDALVGPTPTRTQASWLAFLVTRPIVCGSGKVGSERGEACAFQFSQRADFIETLRGLQTTYRRPLLNTRNEAHADRSRFRRLHVIVGDANMAEYSTLLKVGTAQVVLGMAEEDALPEWTSLRDPLIAVRTVSRDRTFAARLPLQSGAEASALEIQRAFQAAARQFVIDRPAWQPWADVVALWGECLDALTHDWKLMATRLDWAVKRQLLERWLAREGCDWETTCAWQAAIEATAGWPWPAHPDREAMAAFRRQRPSAARAFDRCVRGEGLDPGDFFRQRDLYATLRRLDVDYHEVRLDPARLGLFYRLQARGGVERLLKDDEFGAYVDAPPTEARSHLRGRLIADFAGAVCASDWDVLVFDRDGAPLVVELSDPTLGTSDHPGGYDATRDAIAAQIGRLRTASSPERGAP